MGRIDLAMPPNLAAAAFSSVSLKSAKNSIHYIAAAVKIGHFAIFQSTQRLFFVENEFYN